MPPLHLSCKVNGCNEFHLTCPEHFDMVCKAWIMYTALQLNKLNELRHASESSNAFSRVLEESNTEVICLCRLMWEVRMAPQRDQGREGLLRLQN